MTAPPPIAGVIPIVVTPFGPDGSVDLRQFDSEIEFLAAAGCEWIGFGYGSEVTTLSPDELTTLIQRTVTVADGALHVIGNADISSVPAGTASVERMADAGAHAVMVRPNGLAGLPLDAVVDTLAGVVSAAGVPIVIQDAPQNTGVELPVPVLTGLLTDAAAVKVETPSPAAKIGDLRHPGSGAILGGIGGLDFFHELLRGASGTMPGPAFPEIFRGIQARHDAGHFTAAFQLWARVLPLINLSLRNPETFLTVQKHILTTRKVLDGSHLRQPHALIDPQLIPELDRLVGYVGLWELIDECRLA